MNPFIARLADKKAGPPLGTFLMAASPLVAEAIGCSGFDWAIVDAEHSPIGVPEIAHMLQAVGCTPMLPVVRVPWNDMVIVKRILDAGASTLLFPFVQSAEEAERAVRATRYPPEGQRGMAGLSRASRFGALKDHFRVANDNIGIIVQIETLQAVDQIEKIAAVPGVDAVFIGPTDLSGSMGLHGQGGHPEVQEVLADCARRCTASGIPIGTLAGTIDAARAFAQQGFDYVVLASDLGLMLSSARAALAQWRHPGAGPGLGAADHVSAGY